MENEKTTLKIPKNQLKEENKWNYDSINRINLLKESYIFIFLEVSILLKKENNKINKENILNIVFFIHNCINNPNGNEEIVLDANNFPENKKDFS